MEDQQGWSDDGGDGGDPVKPPSDHELFPNKSKRRADSLTRRVSHNSFENREENRASPPRGRGQSPLSRSGRKTFNSPRNKAPSSSESSTQWPAVSPAKQPAESHQDLSTLKELVIRATKLDDAPLINELTLNASKDASFRHLIKCLAEGKATSAQLDEFDRKLGNAKSLLSWERGTTTATDQSDADKYGGAYGGW